MAKLSDSIEVFIKSLMKDDKKNILDIQRNELACYFSCAPSQINYVLSTRFSSEKGYFVESRRGGGGYIRIRRVEYDDNQPLFSLINEKVGDNITYDSALKIIESLLDNRHINIRESNIMLSAVNDRSLVVATGNKNELRASIVKAMMISVFFNK
ncbi:CtsR family transcriptional regulator [Clostridium sp. DL1XJH146]